MHQLRTASALAFGLRLNEEVIACQFLRGCAFLSSESFWEPSQRLETQRAQRRGDWKFIGTVFLDFSAISASSAFLKSCAFFTPESL